MNQSMDNNLHDNSMFVELVEKIVDERLKKHGLLFSEWRLGKVASVISSTLLSVYIDGSTTAEKVPCNPNVTFAVNNSVFVYRSRDGKIKFVPYKRGV